MAWASIGFLSGLAEHIELLEGQLPTDAAPSDPAVDVLVSRALADKLGLQAGERYVLFSRTEAAAIPVRVAGVWAPRDMTEPFWFYAPQAFDEVLLVTEATFRGRLAPSLRREVGQAAWYLILDGRSLGAGQMAAFLALEQAAVVFGGGMAGTGIGLAAGRLFIPFLQVGPQTPPFMVRIAWGELGAIYAVFGAMFAVAVVALGALLGRMRVFEAVKLGEAV